MDIIHMLSEDEQNYTHLTTQGKKKNNRTQAFLPPSSNFYHLAYCIEKWENLKHIPCDFLTDLPDCQGDRPEGQMATVMENMVLFTTTLLQRLYGGTFLGDNEKLLNFLADQIGTVREATTCFISTPSKPKFHSIFVEQMKVVLSRFFSTTL